MKYDDIPNLSREYIEEALSRNNSAELARAVLSTVAPLAIVEAAATESPLTAAPHHLDAFWEKVYYSPEP